MDLEQKVKIAVDALEDIKATDINIINTEERSSLFSFIIICTANSNRQALALANNVIEEFKNHNIPIVSIEGMREGAWVLVDIGELVVHIMLPQVRTYYNLEALWQDQ